MALSTITLQQVSDIARTHVELLPLVNVGGFTNEPALSLCNSVLQEILGHPFDWKFNRVEMPMFVTAPNRQDYQFAGATAFTFLNTVRGVGIGLASTPAITQSGFVVTVNTLDPHGFTTGDTVYMLGNVLAAYNSTFTQTDSSSIYSGGWVITATPTSTSFTFTHASSGLGNSGAPGITDFGWLSSGSMVDILNTNSPQPIRDVTTSFDLKPTSRVGNPEKVCVIKDLGTGILKLRLKPACGTSIWGVNLVYQAKAPLLASLASTWSPVPDEFSYIYKQGFLAHAYRYQNSTKEVVEDQKFQRAIAKGLTQGDREERDVSIVPSEGLVTGDFFGGY